jgi:hypothetical protein
MGLTELLECSARLRPTKESLDVLVGKIEHGGTVTLGVFIPVMYRDVAELW